MEELLRVIPTPLLTFIGGAVVLAIIGGIADRSKSIGFKMLFGDSAKNLNGKTQITKDLLIEWCGKRQEKLDKTLEKLVGGVGDLRQEFVEFRQSLGERVATLEGQIMNERKN